MVNTREIAEEYRLTYWAGIMKARQESGLSIKAYSKLAGFHENVYFYWQRKLRKAALGELACGKAPSQELKTNEALVPKGWALCETAVTTSKNKTLAIEIGPCRVLANQEVDQELLLKVCRVLVQL